VVKVAIEDKPNDLREVLLSSGGWVNPMGCDPSDSPLSRIVASVGNVVGVILRLATLASAAGTRTPSSLVPARREPVAGC
jgi:hypothetical protein